MYLFLLQCNIFPLPHFLLRIFLFHCFLFIFFTSLYFNKFFPFHLFLSSFLPFLFSLFAVFIILFPLLCIQLFTSPSSSPSLFFRIPFLSLHLSAISHFLSLPFYVNFPFFHIIHIIFLFNHDPHFNCLYISFLFYIFYFSLLFSFISYLIFSTLIPSSSLLWFPEGREGKRKDEERKWKEMERYREREGR